jgi:hypothetical protein
VASIVAGGTGLVIERATQETVPDLDRLVNETGHWVKQIHYRRVPSRTPAVLPFHGGGMWRGDREQ